MIDSYFNLRNFTQPIGSFLTEKYYYYCVPGTIKYTDIFIKENKLELTDNFLQLGGPVEKKFYSVSDVKESWAYYGGPEYVYVKLQLDPETQLYKRTVYSILDLIGQLGGVFGILSSVFTLIVGIYSENMLFHSIVKKCYQVEADPQSQSNIQNPTQFVEDVPQSAIRLQNSPVEELENSKDVDYQINSDRRAWRNIREEESNSTNTQINTLPFASKLKSRRRYGFSCCNILFNILC